MATKPYTIANGQNADGSQLESNFNEIYSNITNTNIASGAAIGWSKIDSTGQIINTDLSANAGLDPIKFTQSIAFKAIMTADQAMSVTQTALTTAYVAFNSALFDLGSDYSGSVNGFVVPRNGLYSLGASVYLSANNGYQTRHLAWIENISRSANHAQVDGWGLPGDKFMTINLNTIAKLSAGDLLKVGMGMALNSMLGTGTFYTFGNYESRSQFWGYYIGNY